MFGMEYIRSWKAERHPDEIFWEGRNETLKIAKGFNRIFSFCLMPLHELKIKEASDGFRSRNQIKFPKALEVASTCGELSKISYTPRGYTNSPSATPYWQAVFENGKYPCANTVNRDTEYEAKRFPQLFLRAIFIKFTLQIVNTYMLFSVIATLTVC